MSQNVAEFVWKRLNEWGLSRVYGYPGDGVGGLDVALEKAKDFMDYVQVRHEEMAAFMASAHAKFTGQVGLCYATSGPGAIHLLNGLYDAKMDHVPVVAIVGQQARSALGASYQQEVDLQNLFKDVAGILWRPRSCPGRCAPDRSRGADRAGQAGGYLRDHSERSTGTRIRGPANGSWRDAYRRGLRRPATLPNIEDLRKAAEMLNEGEKVAILVGAGALQRHRRGDRGGQTTQAGVAKALLGKAAVPDDLPFVTGSIGLLGTKPSWDLMKRCDTFLMVGQPSPIANSCLKPGRRAGRPDRHRRRQCSRCAIRWKSAWSATARRRLRALLPLLEQNQNEAGAKAVEKSVAEWWKTLEERAHASRPIRSTRSASFGSLSPRLPDDCIMTGDSGSVANWYARDIRMRRGMMGSLSGGLASLGAATPYAIAAKMAYPDRPVIGFIGDGAMQMNGLNVMITVRKYWRRWSDPRFISMVLNNRDLNQVTWEERVQLGDGKTPLTQSNPGLPLSQICRAARLQGHLLSMIPNGSVRRGTRRWPPTVLSS